MYKICKIEYLKLFVILIYSSSLIPLNLIQIYNLELESLMHYYNILKIDCTLNYRSTKHKSILAKFVKNADKNG